MLPNRNAGKELNSGGHIIRAQRDRGATVFLNSHLLSEIEVTCDQVVFIRDGEIITTRDFVASGTKTCA
jgi:ABC-type multidrug transport system ATPase subunit